MATVSATGAADASRRGSTGVLRPGSSVRMPVAWTPPRGGRPDGMAIKIYAETPGLRLRQQLQDTATLVWVAAWGLAGRTLYRTIERLRTATAEAEQAGQGIARRLDDVARTVTDVPLVGNALRRPFTGAADAGRNLQ